MNIEEIVENIFKTKKTYKTKFAINIGCGNGKDFDPLYPLYTNGYIGVVFDYIKHENLEKNLPNPKIIKHIGTKLDPDNICYYFDKYNIPKFFDILKIDIDSYDGPILKSILLKGFIPRIIIAEINPDIPPPISFSVLYSDKYKILDDNKFIGGFYGMSLSYAVNLCSSFHYNLYQLDFVSPGSHDAIFIHDDFIFKDSDISTRRMWLNHPIGYPHFQEYGIDSLLWRNENNIDRLGYEIKEALIKSCRIKHNGLDIPFYYDY